MKPLRILISGQIYSDGNGQGGFTMRLAENLVKEGHRVKMLMPSDKPESYSVSIHGVQVEKVAAIHMKIVHPIFRLTPLPGFRVKKIFQDFAPDLAHVQDHHFLSKAVVQEALLYNIPLIGTNHFLPDNLLPFLIKFPRLRTLAGNVLWKMMLDVYNQLDVITTPSKAAAEILREQKIQPPVYAISNGVDTSRFFPDPKIDSAAIRRKYGLATEKPLFLYIGRLDGEKRVDILLDAVSKLKDMDLQLVIAGDGVRAQMLRHKAHHLGLDGRVAFLGYVSAEELPGLYAASDAFIMPSPAELQSIATLEAIACAKPVLAANARALPELVTHNVNGYLFEPNNADDTAYWMKKFLDNPEQWSKMGKESFIRSQPHTIQSTIKAYEDCYQMVIEKKKVIRRPSVFRTMKLFEAFKSKKVVKQ